MPDENTIPMELMPEGCVPSVYGPLPGTPNTWASCIHRGSKAYRMGYGGTPRQAVLSALAQVKATEKEPT